VNCYRCLTQRPLIKVKRSTVRGLLRWIFPPVKCDSCLSYYYRVPILGLLIPGARHRAIDDRSIWTRRPKLNARKSRDDSSDSGRRRRAVPGRR